MSYFSRVRLDVSHPQAREALLDIAKDNAYLDHQRLWRFFPSETGTARDFLFRRMDAQAASEPPVYYLVSARAPKCPHPAWQLDTREYTPQLRRGDQLVFDLRANPVRSHARNEDGAQKDKRDDVVMHAKKQLAARHNVTRWSEIPAEHRPALYALVKGAVSEWLTGSERAPGALQRKGFQLHPDSLQVDSYRKHRFPRKGTKDREIQLATVDIRGTVAVEDPDAAHAALLSGIGHAKAFGCGLLLVRRAGT